jgi:hypothetical protein
MYEMGDIYDKREIKRDIKRERFDYRSTRACARVCLR